MQEAPIHQGHVYGRIKIWWTVFEKGHPRNIPVKSFQNQTWGFREEDFLRISSCLYSARSSHSPGPCLWTDQNFANKFWKGSPKEHSYEIISKSDQWFWSRRFFKNCLKNSISLPWQPEFLMESNSVNNFWRGPPKEHSCRVWSKLAHLFGRRRCLKKLLTTHDRHITTLKAPLEHVVLRWAKKLVTSVFSISHNVWYPSQNKFEFLKSHLFYFFALNWTVLQFLCLAKN